ncbi:MAG: hypothetical protein LBO70_02955 [Clostridiales Family XIII bacterium]|jgi:4-diphosphocytidyl-2-C-methyl-D-erythritol kinase|nr:hypothetical protein [Clostridiales Family XIII bacterium]
MGNCINKSSQDVCRYTFVRAYAKINLSLSVIGKRPDGYHLISSRMQAISLHDDVTVEVSAYAGGPDIEVGAAFAPDAQLGLCELKGGLPQGRGNIAYGAAGLALSLWGNGLERVRVSIAKRVPMAAGLAGGSADAAVVMLALARLLSPGMSTELPMIMKAGAKIGADVPFCVFSAARGNPELGFAEAACPSAICKGIGDELTPAVPEVGWVVLVKPAVKVMTPRIYAGWDELNETGRADAMDTDNDLARVAIMQHPVIGRVLDEVVEASGADRVFMTGSGPTIVALYADAGRAESGFATLRRTYKDRADVGAVLLSKLL